MKLREQDRALSRDLAWRLVRGRLKSHHLGSSRQSTVAFPRDPLLASSSVTSINSNPAKATDFSPTTTHKQNTWSTAAQRYLTLIPSPYLYSCTTKSAIMSDGALKPEKDFSKEADKQIPEAEALAKVQSGVLTWSISELE